LDVIALHGAHRARHLENESRCHALAAGEAMPYVLDDFFPRPFVRERREISVRAPVDIAFETACDFDLLSIPIVRAIFRLRAVLMRAAPPPRRWTGLVAETSALGWGTLVEVPDRLHVAGAVCQPWVGNVVFTPIPPEQFASYSQPDRVKIVWTIEAEPLGAERTRLATETRVVPTDLAARRKFRRYWRKAGIGILLIRWLGLPAMRRKAERRWREALRSSHVARAR
jgi:hypothetical protein